MDALTAELEAALVRALRTEYDRIAWLRFGERLKPPILALSETTARLGRWVSAERTLELSRELVLGHGWPEVVGVLEHEMAHQYVDEVLGVRDEGPHGETFHRICTERGIDARAAGAPVATTDGEVEGDRVLDRIRKLLALAGSSNQHEAELAMRTAHELMLRHNIAAAQTSARKFVVGHLGDPTKRTTRVELDVVNLLAEFFFVEVIRVPIYLPRLGRAGHQFEISGTRANIELADHVYAFLLATADRLWTANRDDARVTSGRDRLAYQAGVIRGFREKLLLERAKLSGTGLVWVGDAGLDDFVKLRHPRLTTRRRRLPRGNSAHAAGREAGRTVVLHKPVSRGPTGGIRLLATGNSRE